MCSVNQSKCMKGCYAKAAEKCAEIPGQGTNKDEENQNEVEKKHSKVSIGIEVWIAAATAFGFIIIKIAKICFNHHEVEWDSTFQDALLEDGDINEQPTSLHMSGLDMFCGSNSEMINVHSSMLVPGGSGLAHSMSAHPYSKHY